MDLRFSLMWWPRSTTAPTQPVGGPCFPPMDMLVYTSTINQKVIYYLGRLILFSIQQAHVNRQGKHDLTVQIRRVIQFST